MIRFFAPGYVCGKGQSQDLNPAVCSQSTWASLDLTPSVTKGLEVHSLACCRSLGSLELGAKPAP